MKIFKHKKENIQKQKNKKDYKKFKKVKNKNKKLNNKIFLKLFLVAKSNFLFKNLYQKINKNNYFSKNLNYFCH